jgi:hypothetical protein
LIDLKARNSCDFAPSRPKFWVMRQLHHYIISWNIESTQESFLEWLRPQDTKNFPLYIYVWCKQEINSHFVFPTQMFQYKANFAGESWLAVHIELSLRCCLWFSVLNQANVCYKVWWSSSMATSAVDPFCSYH